MSPRAVLFRLAPLTSLALLAACAPAAAPPGAQAGSGRLGVFASIPPLVTFAQAVGGERVQAQTLVKPGQDPHTFEPAPRQLADLARARVFFRAGFAFEEALVARLRSTMPGLEVVDTREGIRLRPVEEHHGEEQHDDGLDPHVWMDPRLAARQCLTIRDTLVRLDPAGGPYYRANCERFTAELEALHQRIAAALAPLRGAELLVFHPAFGYLADAYGLKQVAVESGGKEPTARQLARLIEQARARGIRVVFVQPQFSQTGARAVADAIGGTVVPLDDLAADYLANLARAADTIREALR